LKEKEKQRQTFFVDTTAFAHDWTLPLCHSLNPCAHTARSIVLRSNRNFLLLVLAGLVLGLCTAPVPDITFLSQSADGWAIPFDVNHVLQHILHDIEFDLRVLLLPPN